jgi:hypothetical protein
VVVVVVVVVVVMVVSCGGAALHLGLCAESSGVMIVPFCVAVATARITMSKVLPSVGHLSQSGAVVSSRAAVATLGGSSARHAATTVW